MLLLKLQASRLFLPDGGQGLSGPPPTSWNSWSTAAEVCSSPSSHHPPPSLLLAIMTSSSLRKPTYVSYYWVIPTLAGLVWLGGLLGELAPPPPSASPWPPHPPGAHSVCRIRLLPALIGLWAANGSVQLSRTLALRRLRRPSPRRAPRPSSTSRAGPVLLDGARLASSDGSRGRRRAPSGGTAVRGASKGAPPSIPRRRATSSAVLPSST